MDLWRNEQALALVLFEAERKGVKVDRDYLASIQPTLQAAADEAQAEMFTLAGTEFNPNSGQQLAKVLIDAGATLPTTPKGAYQTDRKTLEALAGDYPLATAVVAYRRASKLLGTYYAGLVRAVDAHGYVHSSFNQNVSTGRMSSSNPNMQNIDPRIRPAFVVPSSEYIYVFIDYSQMELRLLAHISGDPDLLACYPFEGEGQDMHMLTARDVIVANTERWSKMAKEDKAKARKAAKTVNFGIVYGQTDFGLSAQLGITKKIAQQYIDRFYERFPGIKAWKARTIEALRRDREVRHELGRVRHFPDYRLGQPDWLLAGMERKACNFQIQGWAADLFKVAAVGVAPLFRGKRSWLCNFVHDEMQFYIHKTELDLIPQIVAVMEDSDLKVPMRTEVCYSTTNWGAKVPWEGKLDHG